MVRVRVGVMMFFLLLYSKQPTTYTIKLISTAELFELYILTNSDIKADKQHFRYRQTIAELYSSATNPVLYKFQQSDTITKTYLYYFDPVKPHFYLVKLGFTGVYIIFLISAQKHRL